MNRMPAPVPAVASLSAEARAVMRAAGLVDEQGHLIRTLVEQALAEGDVWRMTGRPGAAGQVLMMWLDASAVRGEA
jgi:hypothetical protein